MKRLEYPFNHEWHVAINKHSDKEKRKGKDWPRFMFEAKTAADELPRLEQLFKLDREGKLPDYHKQCSMSEKQAIDGNCLTCCLGVKTNECQHLLSLEKIKRSSLEDIDAAKAWTCVTHIISSGGDTLREGYILTKGDMMYWSKVYENLSQQEV